MSRETGRQKLYTKRFGKIPTDSNNRSALSVELAPRGCYYCESKVMRVGAYYICKGLEIDKAKLEEHDKLIKLSEFCCTVYQPAFSAKLKFCCTTPCTVESMNSSPCSLDLAVSFETLKLLAKLNICCTCC